MSAQNTKKRILDTAEHLFASRGFHKTSLREITRHAGVNIASVNYHFGSREALIREVVLRRLRPINEERLRLLHSLMSRYSSDGNSLPVDQILRAFLEPSATFLKTEPAANDFVRIMGQGMVDPDDSIRKLFFEQVKPVFTLMMQLLEQALPGVPVSVIHVRLHCFIGAFAHWMRLMGSTSEMSDPHIPEDSPEEVMNIIVSFCQAGMEAPL